LRGSLQFGGIYASTLRNEGTGILPAIDEALRIGREAHIPVENLAFQSGGKTKLGTHAEAIAKVNALERRGSTSRRTLTLTLPWFYDSSAFIPAVGPRRGTPSSSERLKDPQCAIRIRKDMLTPSDQWTTNAEIPAQKRSS